jgi:acetyl-CoA/propionyl-CoA carboxylase, biotin carboxylase, biotin carboxyl carrier protein
VVPAMLAVPASAAVGAPATERSNRSRPAGRGARGPARGAGGDALVTPMQGTIVKIVAPTGSEVKTGDTVVILEAMKMEQPLTAHKDGTVTGLAVEVGQTVSAGTEICQIKE